MVGEQLNRMREEINLTFVVGTGRCGSTMLSNLLREHRAVLSLSEFYTMLEDRSFPEGIVEAHQFWQILSTPGRMLTAQLRSGAEFLYRITETSRFNTETGIPPILLITLPHLTDDYEALYNELEQAVCTFPSAQIEQHYIRLFEWLKQRFGREVCVERSGFSLAALPQLIKHFPGAKFVHIARDGRECAMSMSHHFAFRGLALALMELQEGRGTTGTADVQGPGMLNEAALVTRLAQFDSRRWDTSKVKIPIAYFGSLWSQSISKGIYHLSKQLEEQVLTITYEQIIEQPQATLRQLLTFIEPSLIDESWVQSITPQVKQKTLSWTSLPVQEREALEVACQPGLTLLKTTIQEGLHSEKLTKMFSQSFQ